MATLETQQVDAIIDNSRRKMITLGGTALAGLALAGLATQKAEAAVTDTDILNFALNLEYLEANFYNLAVYGVTINNLPTPISIDGGQAKGSGGTVTTKPNFAKVPFVIPLIQAYATETAGEEGKHVSFLQTALGSAAVAQPNLDLYMSFQTLATAAGITNPSPFDPFANDAAFLLGAYIFEDVGVTAYHGAAPFISDKKGVLAPAVAIHAVEAYHAGLIRTTLAGLDYASASTTFATLTGQISALRTTLSNSVTGGNTAIDVGVTTSGIALTGSSGQYQATTVVDSDPATGMSPGRLTSQILAIVTAGNSGGATDGSSSGLFFPNGLNGNIR